MIKPAKISDWVKKSQEDLLTAQGIIKVESPAWAACFHCQQSLEKILKAAQIHFLNDFEKTHDLILLSDSLIEYLDLRSFSNDLFKLSTYYVSTRYPGLEQSKIDREKAIHALNSARIIVDYVIKKIQ